MTKKLKLTPRGRHALTAMVEIASREGRNAPLSLPVIIERVNCSMSYLESLFAALRNAGLVRSYRGPGGGYTLAKDADDITVAEIYEAAENCSVARKYDMDEEFPADIQAVLDHVGEVLHDTLSKITLAKVVSGYVRTIRRARKELAA